MDFEEGPPWWLRDRHTHQTKGSMSHITEITTQVRDVTAIRAACQRLSLAPPEYRPVALFSSEATGWAVTLPEWHYPIVCDTARGTLSYDNYEGRWGHPRELDRFLQAYAIEKCRLEARKQGHHVTEAVLADGTVRLTMRVGGCV